ncbi:exodeoxyribonuclease iii [Raphidocelis subcapitata]|uniref:DNA-(apurinic or apyrimidinic site) endonuclease n=1 Tax=Raphidocelis subcapitata TaxID=307507 RepID=A0A2V0P9Q7_9CHLO|nr:exodeoxyribonuclease iii [Raphidocelis subcapitata]|eukprot:GBF96576.1 exodeoxyribonuclease iii [Raphidocelis subcapitata]
MRIVSWNVASLPPTVRNIELAHGSLAAFFKGHLAADVVCLQEVKLSSEKLTKELVCVDGFESFWATSEERKGYSGVTTWTAAPDWRPEGAEPDCLGCREGRIVVTDHGPFAIINVYVPNAGERPERDRLGYKLRFLGGLKDEMDALAARGKQASGASPFFVQPGGDVIAVGDFNVPAAQEDLFEGAAAIGEEYDPGELAAMRGLIADYPDVWRLRHPDTRDQFSVWDWKTSARAFNRGSRIDYVLLSKSLLPLVTACEIRFDLPKTWSDHAPIYIDLDMAPPAPGRPPCRAWLQLQRRFVDPNQRSIASMFGAARGAGRGHGSGGGGGRGAVEQARKQAQATTSSGGGGGDVVAQAASEERPQPNAAAPAAAASAAAAAGGPEESGAAEGGGSGGGGGGGGSQGQPASKRPRLDGSGGGPRSSGGEASSGRGAGTDAASPGPVAPAATSSGGAGAGGAGGSGSGGAGSSAGTGSPAAQRHTAAGAGGKGGSRGGAAAAKGGRGRGKKAAPAAPPGTKSITAFFSKKPGTPPG